MGLLAQALSRIVVATIKIRTVMDEIVMLFFIRWESGLKETYATIPKDSERRLVREIFTMYIGKVYFLRWYAKASNKNKYASEFQ